MKTEKKHVRGVCGLKVTIWLFLGEINNQVCVSRADGIVSFETENSWT